MAWPVYDDGEDADFHRTAVIDQRPFPADGSFPGAHRSEPPWASARVKASGLMETDGVKAQTICS